MHWWSCGAPFTRLPTVGRCGVGRPDTGGVVGVGSGLVQPRHLPQPVRQRPQQEGPGVLAHASQPRVLERGQVPGALGSGRDERLDGVTLRGRRTLAAHHGAADGMHHRHVGTEELQVGDLPDQARPAQPLVEQALVVGGDHLAALEVRPVEADQVTVGGEHRGPVGAAAAVPCVHELLVPAADSRLLGGPLDGVLAHAGAPFRRSLLLAAGVLGAHAAASSAACRRSDGGASAGRPVRARNTSSRLGRRSPRSTTPILASSRRRTATGSQAGSGMGTLIWRTSGSTVAWLPVRPVSRAAARSRSVGSAGRTSRTCPPILPLSSSGIPVAMTCPWSITAMWWVSWSASSMYWVVSRTVVSSATSSRITAHRPLRLRGSSPVVGSSRNSTGGRPTRLAARSRRRRMPPE